MEMLYYAIQLIGPTTLYVIYVFMFGKGLCANWDFRELVLHRTQVIYYSISISNVRKIFITTLILLFIKLASQDIAFTFYFCFQGKKLGKLGKLATFVG